MDEIQLLLENMDTLDDLSRLHIILFKLMTERYNIGMIMKLNINDNGVPIAATVCSIGLQVGKLTEYNLTNYPIIRKGVIVGSLIIGTSNDVLDKEDEYHELLSVIGSSLTKLR
jgi:hypothetical protein